MAYVERHRGGRHLVEAETGISAQRLHTFLATLRPDVARRTDLEYML